MNTMTNLLKDYRAGLWCKCAAWVVLALGILHIASILFYYNQINYYSHAVPGAFALILMTVLSSLPSFVFYFSILYVAGKIIDHVTLKSLQNRQQIPPRPW
jgi:cobalamin synthase